MDKKNMLKKIMKTMPLKLFTSWKGIVCFTIIYGIIGSHVLLGLNFFDCIYFMTITMATVGYGDIVPTTIPQKMFAVTLAILGVAIAAYAFTLVLSNFTEKMNEVAEEVKIMKKINKMDEYYLICGYGRVGAAVYKKIKERKQNVVIIEKDSEKTKKIAKEENTIIITDDATDYDILKPILTEKCNSVIVTAGSDVTNLFIVLSIREINKDILIVSRINKLENKNKLIQAGANDIVSPELIGGGDLYYNAVQNQMLKITVKNTLKDLITRAELINECECRLESIEFHLKGIIKPFPMKIHHFDKNNIEAVKKITEDPERKEELINLYKTSNYIHSEWITCPNKAALNTLLKKNKKDDSVIGINLTNKEIYEINK